MEDFDYRITHFLKEHDMPCDGCAYNLRGIESLICPECGERQPYKDFAELMEYRRKHEIFEVGEFRFARQLGVLLSIVFLIDAFVLGIGGVIFGPQADVYWIIPAFFFVASIVNASILRRLFYTKRRYTTEFWSAKADKKRDGYGVLVMIAIVPAASMIVLIPMMLS